MVSKFEYIMAVFKLDKFKDRIHLKNGNK